MVEPEILAYYEHNDERGRLASGGRRIEFLRVWDLLERFLPAAPATVLDVGGGAGRYAVPLAAQGYQVHLVDAEPSVVGLSQNLVATARVPVH
jgi:2-polyprenyl-3-methyl-5-hydroxy-6-metoxy-1,4-benzoquinol methylase